MRYARILSKLYGEPLMLETRAWHAFDHALRNLMNGGTATVPSGAAVPQGQTEKQYRNGRVLEIRTDTALIYFDGVIDKHLSLFELDCYGGVDLDDIDAALAQVANDDQIRNVMLVFNSPGGSVIGVEETANKVYALGQEKNVKSFTDSVCASGAIYIASQATEFFATASSYVGSIGVILALLDFSKQLEMDGITPNIIKNGKYKGMGSALKPLTDEERAIFQATSNKIYGMFTAAVLRGRPDVSDETMQGQCFFGSDAVEAGLVDAIVPDLAAALAQF